MFAPGSVTSPGLGPTACGSASMRRPTPRPDRSTPTRSPWDPTVKVRSGQFRPDTAEGLGLLAHEASHVTALLARGAAARRNTPDGVAAEETVAARVERLGQQSPAVSHPAGAPPVGYDAHAVGPTQSSAPGTTECRSTQCPRRR